MSQLLKLGLLFFPAVALAEQQSIELVLSRIEADVEAAERPANLPRLLVGIEDDLVGLPEQAKQRVVMRIVSLSMGMLGLRDQAVPLDGSVRRWPEFDWDKYGAKPLFAGASPDAIEDRIARAAYVKVLADHDVLLSRIDDEKAFLEDIDYLLALGRRVIESSSDPQAIYEAASAFLAQPEGSQPAATYIRRWLVDRPVSGAVNPPQSDEQGEPGAMDDRSIDSARDGEAIVQPPTPVEGGDPKTFLRQGWSQGSSIPWGITGVLALVIGGLLLVVRKMRR